MSTPAAEIVPPPAVLARPLALVAGRAYAAAWPHTRASAPVSDSAPPPAAPPDLLQDLLILRDDGLAFGAGGDRPLTDLAFQLRFPFIPPAHRLWSAPALQAYRLGQRPDPALTFNRLADVFDHFVDFENSLADQRPMAEFMALFTLSTWFSDAFSMLGLLWLTGDHPASLTQLLGPLSRLSHLGLQLPPQALTPTLHGFAGYGAALAFDDTLSSTALPKRNPAWRQWLLASSRRDAFALDRAYDQQHRRHILHAVSAFCPRILASTLLPDSRLAPDCLTIPLVASGDPARAARLPNDPAAWPHNPDALYDDLWALGLAHLPSMPAFAAQVASNLPSVLPPASLHPWRALLAVAAWLTAHGVPGLSDRLLALAAAHYLDRADQDSADFIAFVIRAIMEKSAGYARYAIISKGGVPFWEFSTKDIISAAELMHEPESDLERDSLTQQRVGRAIRRLGVKRPPRSSKPAHPRLWKVSLRDLERWSSVYGIPLPEKLTAFQFPAPELPPNPPA